MVVSHAPHSWIDALRSPSAYPVPTAGVEVIETHISTVFLLDRDVFKVKKSVDLGFLDFSTLERRRHFCEEEVRLNRRLAPEVYLGVVPIAREGAGYRVGGTGEAIEYAVHMVRLPDSARLETMVAEGRVPEGFWRRLGKRLARFHREAERSPEIARGGSFEIVARHARENFSATERFVGAGISERLHLRVAEATDASLSRLRSVIESRAARGVPCDTHGDLRLDHVYHFPDREHPRDLLIIDGIEFSPILRHADPVSDVAFLAMDLRFAGEDSESTELIEAYLRASGDEDGRALFPFYIAYRNAVRAKVDLFTIAGSELSASRLGRLEERALGHWLLALVELEPPERRPALVLVGGPPGCGKSTLARSLATTHEFEWIRSDAVRKEIHAGLDGDALYTPERTTEVYVECLERADAIVSGGGRALIDATYHADGPRLAARDLARRRRIPIIHLDLTIDRKTAHARIAGRQDDPSDADPSVHDALVAEWEAPSAETKEMRVAIPAAGTSAEVLHAAENSLRARGITR